MKFSIVSLVTALTAVVTADPNGFIKPTADDVLKAGEKFVVRWNNTDGGDKVTLKLKKGKSDDLQNVLTIAKDLKNQGAVRWSVPPSVKSGDNYAIVITEADDESKVNYTPQFKIEGDKDAAAKESQKSSNGTSSAAAAATTSAKNATSSAMNTSAPLTTASKNISTAGPAATDSGSVETSTAIASKSADGGSGGSKGAASQSAAASGSKSSEGAASFLSIDSLALAGGLGAALLAL